MKIKVNVAAQGSGPLASEEVIELFCGNGEQILAWVGQAACQRLAFNRGEVYGRYVPQAVMSKEGQALDIHIVLNEICGDGDELFVEYANGPVAYRVRWDGRPRSPPFVWGIDGEMVPAHDAWLTGMNLRAEGMAALVEPDVRDSPEALAAELAAAKDVLIRHAGALQMFFLLATSEGVTTSEQLGNLKLPQFKSLMQRAHVISARYPAERVDEVYASVTTSERTMLRKTDAGINPSIFDLMDFMIALLHVAHQRAATLQDDNAPLDLAAKLSSLINDCFAAHLYPELQRKLERFHRANTGSVVMLLERGRPLVEQALNSIQLKRVKSDRVRVELRYVCVHLQKWNLLGREFGLPELATIAVYAKQVSPDPDQFELHATGVELDSAEFEKLLLGICHHMAVMKKKTEEFDDFLAETLDSIFKKAGVLEQTEERQPRATGDEEAASP